MRKISEVVQIFQLRFAKRSPPGNRLDKSSQKRFCRVLNPFWFDLISKDLEMTEATKNSLYIGEAKNESVSVDEINPEVENSLGTATEELIRDIFGDVGFLINGE